jgi:transmembrane sensor
MDSPDYRQYGPDDLLFDEAFRQWVLEPSPEHDAYWQTRLDQYPRLREIVPEARRLVQAVRVRPDELDPEGQARIWQVLETRLVPDARAARRWSVPRRTLAWAASVAVLLVALGGWGVRTYLGEQTITTAYGQTRELTLPDGSTVLLNGNSTLRYPARWDDGSPREVWLEGEAFFRVTKQEYPGGRVKFITHTPNTDIDVLGTQFNVDTRHGNTAVTLVEGKIQLRARQSRLLEMRPGQRAQVPAGTAPVAVERVKVELHDAWTRQLFVFENTPLRDIAQRLRDTYGLEVTFADADLADKRFTANLSSQNLETLLAVIAATYDLTPEQTEGRIHFRRN